MTSVKNEKTMLHIGERVGSRLQGGEVIELIGDVGAGKTTFTKGLGKGLKIDEDVQSPSFTISRVYSARDGVELHHYDFYRLDDAGVMQYELAESINNPQVVTVIEWAETVHNVLPKEHCIVSISYTPEGAGRELAMTVPHSQKYLEEEF